MSILNSFARNIPNPRRIIISRTDKIGDLVLSIPSFFMVHKMYPDAKIVILVSGYNKGIVKNLDNIYDVWAIDEMPFDELLEKVHDFGPDTFVALYSDNLVMKLARQSKALLLVGAFSKLQSWFTYNLGVYQRRSQSIKNEAEYNLDLIRKLDEELFDKNFEIGGKLKYTEDNLKNADKALSKFGVKAPFIIFHAFCGGSANNLKPFEYVKLIDKVVENLPHVDIILTSSKGDFDTADMMKSKIISNKVHVYKSGDDILDLAALIDLSELFVGSSTGPTHIAGNLRKKVVAIFPTIVTQSPTRWGLFGNDKVSYITPDFENIDDLAIENIATVIEERFKE